MKRQRLGRTEVEVTELGFGTAPIGNLYQAIGEDTALGAIEAAWDGGIRYFDTAPHYGLGLAERRLGSGLRDKARADYVISSKVGRLLVDNPSPTGSDLTEGGFDVPDRLTRVRDYSRDGVLRSIDASLRRLGTDRIDIVYVHDPEDHLEAALRQAIPALVELRDQGVVRAVGAGMNLVPPLRRVVAESDVDVVMVAGRWTLVDRTAATLLDECAARGVAVVAAAPFNSGLLARPWPPDGAYFDYLPATSHMLSLARDLADLCAAHRVSLPHAALQFPLLNPGVSTVVTGLRTDAQVRACVEWIETPISPELWTAVTRCRW